MHRGSPTSHRQFSTDAGWSACRSAPREPSAPTSRHFGRPCNVWLPHDVILSAAKDLLEETHVKRVILILSLATSAVGAQTGTLIVTNKTPSTATIIDVASGRPLATLPTGQGPHEVVVSADGRVAVVTDYSGPPRRTLTVIDVPGLKVMKTIDLGGYTMPHGIVFLPRGGDSLVVVTSEQTGNIIIVNLKSGGIVNAIATQGQTPH